MTRQNFWEDDMLPWREFRKRFRHTIRHAFDPSSGVEHGADLHADTTEIYTHVGKIEADSHGASPEEGKGYFRIWPGLAAVHRQPIFNLT